MKIDQFTINNFKSFKDTDNRLSKIADLNYIHGENNSGKSNILKFLKLIISLKDDFSQEVRVEGGEMLSPNTDKHFYNGTIQHEPYIFHKNQRDEPITFHFSIDLMHEEIKNAGFDFYDKLKEDYFKNDKDKAHLEFEGLIKNIDSLSTSEIVLKNVKINKKFIFENKSVPEYFGGTSGTGELVGNKLAFNSLIGYLDDITEYIDNNRYFKKEYYSSNDVELEAGNFKNWLYNLSLNEFEFDKYLELLDFIKNYKIDSLTVLSSLNLSFSINSDNVVELFLDNGSERLPISSFGTGINQLLYILARLYSSKARIILIEELELNLSPNTQRELLNILRLLIKNKKIDQVFFTSHSDYFNFRQDISIYETSINEEGVSKVEYKTGTSKVYFRGE